MRRLVEILRYWFVTLFFAACAHGPLPESPRAGETNVMLVSDVWPSMELSTPLNVWTWRRSPWRCSSTLTTPAQVIIAGDWACVLGTPVVNTPRRGEYFRCPTRWHPPSHAC